MPKTKQCTIFSTTLQWSYKWYKNRFGPEANREITIHDFSNFFTELKVVMNKSPFSFFKGNRRGLEGGYRPAYLFKFSFLVPQYIFKKLQQKITSLINHRLIIKKF